METWREIKGWENAYEVSSEGRVRSITRKVLAKHPVGRNIFRTYKGRILKLGKLKKGYLMVSLTLPNKKRRYAYVHDLVLRAFIGVKPKRLEACHNDGNPENNEKTNLCYDTRSENAKDRIRHNGFIHPNPTGRNQYTVKNV